MSSLKAEWKLLKALDLTGLSVIYLQVIVKKETKKKGAPVYYTILKRFISLVGDGGFMCGGLKPLLAVGASQV